MTAGLIDVPPTTGVGDQYVYGLRTCNAKFEAHGGFVWPEQGWVEAPDWNPDPTCGGGLHFLRNGEGDASLLSADPDAKWMVVRAFAREVVDIDRAKSKARRCEVVYAGSRPEAVTLVRSIVGWDKHICFATDAVLRDGATLAIGSRATITAEGSRATITAKGDGATITAEGYGATITAEGSRATITAKGDDATITVEGSRATITAGRNSFVVVRWWDTEGRRYRFAQASVGDGETLKPDTPYRCVNGVWVVA